MPLTSRPWSLIRRFFLMTRTASVRRVCSEFQLALFFTTGDECSPARTPCDTSSSSIACVTRAHRHVLSSDCARGARVRARARAGRAILALLSHHKPSHYTDEDLGPPQVIHGDFANLNDDLAIGTWWLAYANEDFAFANSDFAFGELVRAQNEDFAFAAESV